MLKPDAFLPLSSSLAETLGTLLGCAVQPGGTGPQAGRLHEVSTLVGLRGDLSGMLVVSVSDDVALKAASTMMLVAADTINDDVVDALGELSMAVLDVVRSQLDDCELLAGVPTVVTGMRHRVRFPSHISPTVLPFDTAWGPLRVELALAPVEVHHRSAHAQLASPALSPAI